MIRKGLFPGSFDPFTKGHEVVVLKALELFDEVVIGIGENSAKNYMFEMGQRIEHIKSHFVNYPQVSIKIYQKLTVEFCKDIHASHIIRGLRDSKDFQYERSIGHMNKAISGIDTVFFLTDPEFSAINSTIIREIFRNGGDISQFVNHTDLLK